MHRQGVAALIALSALGTLGCAAKDQAAAHPDSTATAMATPPAAAVVTVHAKDYAFIGPDTITAGMTQFELINDGPGLHHMQIVRLDSAKTFSDLQQLMSKPPAGPPPGWIVEVGGPNAPAPGTTANATVDLPAGNYALICFVDLPGGVPHFMKGMIRPLTVRPATGADASAPKADVTVDLSDYAFTVSKQLTAGKTTFAVKNDGPQSHEIELIQLAPGKTAQDMLKWLAKMDGPPPGAAVGGIAAQPVGATSYFSADLKPGDYLLVCFIPDSKDGKPHFMKGMVQTVKVS
jgi:hypothetical protein